MYRLADSAEARSGRWISVKMGSVSGKALRCSGRLYPVSLSWRSGRVGF